MITVNFDFSELEGLKYLEKALVEEAAAATRNLAAQAHAKALELANERLHTRRQMFVDALRITEIDGVVALELDAKAIWIDEGKPPGSMVEDMLASPKAKPMKDGGKYLVVPFEHGPGKGPTNATPAQMDLTNVVRAEMKRQKIPWSKIERDDQGRPKLGRLHRFDIMDAPLKTHQGPGQGWGPVGDVRQGPNERQVVGGGPGGGGTPFLAGVGVYQKAQKGGGVKRSVMTFRIVSSNHIGTDRWFHPGNPPTHIFADVEKWAEEQIENVILPDVVESVVRKT